MSWGIMLFHHWAGLWQLCCFYISFPGGGYFFPLCDQLGLNGSRFCLIVNNIGLFDFQSWFILFQRGLSLQPGLRLQHGCFVKLIYAPDLNKAGQESDIRMSDSFLLKDSTYLMAKKCENILRNKRGFCCKSISITALPHR